MSHEAVQEPAIEPISQDVAERKFGAYKERVQSLMDRCGFELSGEVGDTLETCRDNTELERAIENLETFAKRLELGDQDDGPKTREAKRGVFRKHLQELLPPVVKPLDEPE